MLGQPDPRCSRIGPGQEGESFAPPGGIGPRQIARVGGRPLAIDSFAWILPPLQDMDMTHVDERGEGNPHFLAHVHMIMSRQEGRQAVRQHLRPFQSSARSALGFRHQETWHGDTGPLACHPHLALKPALRQAFLSGQTRKTA